MAEPKADGRPQLRISLQGCEHNEHNDYPMSQNGVLVDKKNKLKLCSTGYEVDNVSDEEVIISTNGVTASNIHLKKVIARGSYGVVYLGCRKDTGELLAVKVVSPCNELERRDVARELRTLHKSSDCDHIVRLKGAFLRDGSIHVCMEYMEGGSLDGIYKREGRIPEAPLAHVAHDVLKGIQYLKSMRVLHRDIKPANMVMNFKGQIKLCDVGVCGEMDEKSCAKSTVGTVLYSAPERISGMGDAGYGVRADIWSLGIAIFEMATGKLAYDADVKWTMLGLMEDIVNGPTPELPQGPHSEPLRDFVRLCLQRDPKMRPSPAELLSHPFIVDRPPVDMQSWAQSVCAPCAVVDSDSSPSSSGGACSL